VVAQGKEHVPWSLGPWEREVSEKMPAIAADPAMNVPVRKCERQHHHLLGVEENRS
jgi:hypothetical protein